MILIKQDTDLKFCVHHNFQRLWVKAVEWSFSVCTLRGPAVSGSLGWHEILKGGKVYLGWGRREPKAQWIILGNKRRREQFFQGFGVFFLGEILFLRGQWKDLSMMQVVMRCKSSAVARPLVLLVKPAFADGRRGCRSSAAAVSLLDLLQNLVFV